MFDIVPSFTLTYLVSNAIIFPIYIVYIYFICIVSTFSPYLKCLGEK